MSNRKLIGRVSATEKYPSSCDDFQFWLSDDTILSPFDIVGIDRSPFKNRHKVFFCVVYNGNLCIRQRKSSGHRYCIHIAEVRRHIITKMTRTICNMQNILHHSIGYGIISFILNS